MWNKLTNSKVFYMILAVMCSIGLWLYIDIIEAPQSTTTVYNIPVTFIGEDRLARQAHRESVRHAARFRAATRLCRRWSD